MSAPHEEEPGAGRIVSSLAGLQVLAGAFSRSSTAMELGIELRVAFVVDAVLAWRLVETERFATGRRLRRTRMLCFRLLEEIRRAVQERSAWAAADEQFREAHMVTPGGFAGVTADWVHTKDLDLIFGPTRYGLRQAMCTTSPSHTIILR